MITVISAWKIAAIQQADTHTQLSDRAAESSGGERYQSRLSNLGRFTRDVSGRFRLNGQHRISSASDFFVPFRLISLVLFGSLISLKSENECFYSLVSMATGLRSISKKRILALV